MQCIHSVIALSLLCDDTSQEPPGTLLKVKRACIQATWDKGYWLADMTVPCFTGWHLKLSLAMGTPLLILVALGIPMLPVLLLFGSRKVLHTAPIRSRLGFIYCSYR